MRRAHRARILFLCAAIGFAMTAGVPVPRGEDAAPERMRAAPLIEELFRRYRSSAAFEAEFVQVNEWIVFGEADTAFGRMTLADEHRFDLTYTLPAGHRVGCDGYRVWTFVPEEKQVLRAVWGHTTGWGDQFWEGLRQGADSLAVLHRTETGRELARIHLGARPGWGLRSLTMEIDLADGLPAGYAYLDEEGNRVSFTFLDVQFPSALPEDRFRYTIPDGYELLDVD